MLDEQGDRSLFLEPAPTGTPTDAHEPPAGPTAPLVEVEGGRRRWLAVLVVVALLVAGVVANRRNAEPTVVPDEAALEEAASEPPPAFLAPSLRTTERLGPLLDEPTGTTLLLAAGTQVIVLDVDTGTLRTVQVAELRIPSSYPWGSPVVAVDDSFVVRSSPPRSLLVPRTDGEPVEALDAGSGGGLYPSSRPGRYWVEELRGEGRLEEVDLSGEVDRTVARPASGQSIVWDGSGFVQTVDDQALAFDPDGGESTSLGPGLAVAADGATVAMLRRCAGSSSEVPIPLGAASSCELVLLDRASGSSRTVPPLDDLAGFSAGEDAGFVPSFSPDGRWLLLRAGATSTREPPVDPGAPVTGGIAVIDVSTGTVRAVEPGTELGPPAGAFSPDSQWLFLARPTSSVGASLSAVRLAEGDRFVLDAELELRSGFGIVFEAFPSMPADLGAAGS